MQIECPADWWGGFVASSLVKLGFLIGKDLKRRLCASLKPQYTSNDSADAAWCLRLVLLRVLVVLR